MGYAPGPGPAPVLAPAIETVRIRANNLCWLELKAARLRTVVFVDDDYHVRTLLRWPDEFVVYTDNATLAKHTRR